MHSPHVVIIGAGSTGCATAHDLALRGLRVTVIERGGVASGTTGHNQAQLHSGARYAVHDPESARECIEENWILRKILPGQLELNDGYFVATREAHLEYLLAFLEGCARCGIPAEVVAVKQARREEPLLHPGCLAAVRIPDGVFDPYRLCLSFLATAIQNGAQAHLYSEVKGIDLDRRRVEVVSRANGQTRHIPADLVINAAGPWAGKVAALAGVDLALEASAGVMVTIDRRVCNKVLNLLAPPADGDIIVPQRQTSILGTTSWKVDNPDDIPVPPEHIEQIFAVAEELVPEVRQAGVRGVMAAARPLLLEPGNTGRTTTRRFKIFDHAEIGADGLVSILGGKTCTARGMAEALADLVCRKLGVAAECRTRGEPLLSHRLGWVR